MVHQPKEKLHQAIARFCAHSWWTPDADAFDVVSAAATPPPAAAAAAAAAAANSAPSRLHYAGRRAVVEQRPGGMPSMLWLWLIIFSNLDGPRFPTPPQGFQWRAEPIDGAGRIRWDCVVVMDPLRLLVVVIGVVRVEATRNTPEDGGGVVV